MTHNIDEITNGILTLGEPLTFKCLLICRKILQNDSIDFPSTLEPQDAYNALLDHFWLRLRKDRKLEVIPAYKEEINQVIDENLQKYATFQKILWWTEKYSPLQEKICELALICEHDNPDTLEIIVREEIILGWEEKCEPWHNNWKEIKDHLLDKDKTESRARLEFYRGILQNKGNLKNNSQQELQNVLCSCGLICDDPQKGFRITQGIYMEVFNESWVDEKLKKIPVSPPRIPPTPLITPTSLISRLLNNIIKLWKQYKKNIIFFLRVIAVALLVIIGSSVHIKDPEPVSPKIPHLSEIAKEAKKQFDEGQQLDSLLSYVKEGQQLSKLVQEKKLEEYPIVIFALQYILENIYERNELNKHTASVISLSFRKGASGLLLASAGEDGKVLLSKWSNSLSEEIKNVQQGSISSLDISPSGDIIATVGDSDQTIKLWDSLGKLYRQEKTGETGKVTSVKFSPDGHILAAVKDEGEISSLQLWKRDNSQLKKICELTSDKNNKISSVNFGFYQNALLIAMVQEGGTVSLWKKLNKEDTSEKGDIVCKKNPEDIGPFFRTEKGWDKDTKQQGVRSINFHPVQPFLATAGGDGTIKFWSLKGNQLKIAEKTEKKEFLQTDERNKLKISFSHDGKFIAATGDSGKIQLWRLSVDPKHNDNEEQSLNLKAERVDDVFRDNGPVYSISFSPHDDETQPYYLATAGASKKVRLWELSKLDKPPLYEGERKIKSIIIGLAPAPDKRQRLAILEENGTVRLVDIDNGRRSTLDHDNGKYIEITSTLNQRQYIATVGTQNSQIKVKFWNFLGQQSGQTEIINKDIKIKDLIFFKDDQKHEYLILDVNGDAWYRDVLNNSDIPIPFNGTITSASFNSNGTMIAIGTKDGHTILYSVDELKRNSSTSDMNIKSVSISNISNTVDVVKFSPNDSLLATIDTAQDSAHNIKLWKLPNNLDKQLKGKSLNVKEQPGSVEFSSNGNPTTVQATTVEFSPDGKLIATAGVGKIVKLWDLEGRQVAEFNGDWENTVSLSFTPDNKQIAAAGDNSKVLLWSIQDLDSLIKKSCEWLDDYFKFHPQEKGKEICPSPAST